MAELTRLGDGEGRVRVSSGRSATAGGCLPGCALLLAAEYLDAGAWTLEAIARAPRYSSGVSIEEINSSHRR